MIVAESSTKKPPRTRRSAPKATSGCRTCKIRRVKCDEHKPTCLRCLKVGIKCDGYAPPKGSKPVRQPKALLLPKSRHVLPILPRAPSISRFENEEQSRYFEFFSTNTAYEIFPNVEMGRLRLMFLQACESRDSIRHGIAALGALDMTSRATQPQRHLTGRISHDYSASHHYQSAVKEYARAIKYAQMDDGIKDIRVALITSLIILSFEGWIGNHETAVQQIRIGSRLLAVWKERYRESTKPGYATPSSSEEEDVLAHVFNRLSIQLKSPSKVLDLPSKGGTARSSILSPLPPLTFKLPEILVTMPKSFSTLKEAGQFYSAIVRFAVTFVSQGLARIAKTSSLTGAYDRGVRNDSILPEVTKAHDILTETLHRWMAAFNPLKMSGDFKSLEDQKAAITLELQMKATYMGTVKSLARDELVYDSYRQIYEDIVNLSEALLKCSSASKVPKFSFDSAVIIPLWFTGHKCRDPILRRRVISLLLKYPRREGVWDSIFAGLVIECLRGFEEQYMEKGKVPGWARISTTSFDIDLEKRIVEVRCQQRRSATSTEIVTRRKTVDCYVHTVITLEQIGATLHVEEQRKQEGAPIAERRANSSTWVGDSLALTRLLGMR